MVSFLEFLSFELQEEDKKEQFFDKIEKPDETEENNHKESFQEEEKSFESTENTIHTELDQQKNLLERTDNLDLQTELAKNDEDEQLDQDFNAENNPENLLSENYYEITCEATVKQQTTNIIEEEDGFSDEEIQLQPFGKSTHEGKQMKTQTEKFTNEEHDSTRNDIKQFSKGNIVAYIILSLFVVFIFYLCYKNFFSKSTEDQLLNIEQEISTEIDQNSSEDPVIAKQNFLRCIFFTYLDDNHPDREKRIKLLSDFLKENYVFDMYFTSCRIPNELLSPLVVETNYTEINKQLLKDKNEKNQKITNDFCQNIELLSKAISTLIDVSKIKEGEKKEISTVIENICNSEEVEQNVKENFTDLIGIYDSESTNQELFARVFTKAIFADYVRILNSSLKKVLKSSFIKYEGDVENVWVKFKEDFFASPDKKAFKNKKTES